jgi:predicted RND superfamily exporter protein
MKTRVISITAAMWACLFTLSLFAQSTPKFADCDSAYVNAQKGTLWCLANIKAKRSRAENRLIVNTTVIAQVKLTKEVNGICIVSTGFFGSTEVSTTLYRSFQQLVSEGYLDKNSPLLREDE